LRRLASTMLFDPYHPHSLRRRLNMIVGSAPSKPQGYAAFVVFFIRVLLNRNIEGRWGQEQSERPLSEIHKTAA